MELPLTLIMAGIPIEVVDKATTDQLLVMQEVVNRHIKFGFQTNANSVTQGIGQAFGAKK